MQGKEKSKQSGKFLIGGGRWVGYFVFYFLSSTVIDMAVKIVRSLEV